MQFFIAQRTETPWGDYSDTLIHGEANRNKSGNSLELSRTGPFIPALTIPGIHEIVVTDDLRQELETSGLTGFSFLPVIKHHIVDLEWNSWDWNADEPAFYPDSGEPEDYIHAGSHSEEAAIRMPKLWELKIEETAHVERITNAAGILSHFYFLQNSWTGHDFIRTPEVGYNFVTERAKLWLEERVGQWIAFTLVETRQI